MNKQDRIDKVSQVFSPSAPIKSRDLFFGRMEQFRRLQEAIGEMGQHAVIYGDRGVGKTSLANIAEFIYPDVVVSKVTCNRTESFRSIWEKAFNKITFRKSEKGLGFKAIDQEKDIQLDLFLPDVDQIDSKHIESVLGRLNNKLMFIFDEFDSITDSDTKVRMSDTVKMLSDNMPNVTILIVGIADDVISLIGNHPSIERCLMQIFIPKMSNEELGAIVDGGLNQLDLRINYPQRKKIVEYSEGYPSNTHLLCKHSALQAILNDRKIINYDDFSFAARKAIENASHSLKSGFQKATISNKSETLFLDVIYAVAFAKIDDFGCSSKTDIMDSLYAITEREYSKQRINYYITELCKKERGEILNKVGEKNNIRIKFRNPIMKAFVRLKLHSNDYNVR